MSYFSSSSSSSSLSFTDPSSYNNHSYSTSQFDCNQNPNYNSYYSSSLPSSNYTMPKTPVFNSTSSSSSSTSSCEYYDFNSSPIRRAFSTGVLQSMNGLRVSPNENYAHETGTGSQKIGRYSAEERKERIERYRIKRNQRNFQKKITYACRKTLADSRSRVKGRFARNGENETEIEMEAEIFDTGCETFGYDNYGNYNVNVYNQMLQNECGGTGTGIGTGNEREWWKQEEINYDEVFWDNNFVDVFSDLVR